MIQRSNSDLDVEERFTREDNRLQGSDLDRIADAYRELLQGIGEDADREGLRRTPDPSEDDIRHYLAGNLCRCAAYPEIIQAVKAAAKGAMG